jgi:hypothetical protein
MSLLWLTLPGSSGAAETDSLPPGVGSLRDDDVIRVFSYPHRDPVVGRFISVSSDTIRLKPTALPTISIAMADAEQIDRSRHRTNNTWTGVLLGTLAGVAATAWIVSTYEGEGAVILLGAAFVPVGAGIGALAGSGVVDYHWQSIWKRNGGG